MAVTFEQFLSSIATQESGGNYRVVNSYGAVGKYQVLKSNIPSWSRAALGYSISWQKFRDTPALQERIVRHRMKKYWDKYGIRGAAAAWYSGDPSLHMSTRDQPGGPSIKKYVDDVIARAGGMPSGGSGSAQPYAGGTKVVPKLSDAELAEQYGFTLSFLNANKEIKNLFKQMVSGGWDKSKFQAKLRNTKWWKTHSEEERAYLTLQYTDPAEARQKIQQATIKATQLARQMGLTGGQMSAANMKSYAYLMVAKGYDEAQLRYLMGSKLHLSSKQHTGQAGELWEEAKSYMYQMGSNWSDSRLNTFIQNIARGIGTMQDIKNSVQLEAKAAFPQWAKQIEAGQTVMDIAQPYMQSMTQILEINPGSLNLFDPTIKSTLNWVNPSSLKREAKPLWQFENELRADPRWKKTKNAQDSLMGVAHQVLADFGVKY
jgi:hypothetical protein